MNAIREMGIFIRANNISKPCLQFLTNILEILGVINFHRFKTKRRDLLQEVYCYFVTLVTLFHVVTHFINTTTRAVNYLPEFFQRILEDFVIITVQFQFYLVRRKHAQLRELESFMENTFSRRNPAIVRRCNQTLRIFFCIFIIISALAFIGSFLEAFSALSEQDLHFRKSVYKTKYPERKLPFEIRIPYIDESEPLYYYMIILYQLYLTIVYIPSMCSLNTLLSGMIIHLKGQYQMIYYQIKKLGSTCDVWDFTYLMKNDTGTKKQKLKTEQLAKDRDHQLLREIIQSHQKLLMFQYKVSKLSSAHLNTIPFIIRILCFETFYNSTYALFFLIDGQILQPPQHPHLCPHEHHLSRHLPLSADIQPSQSVHNATVQIHL